MSDANYALKHEELKVHGRVHLQCNNKTRDAVTSMCPIVASIELMKYVLVCRS
jgi:hypothetical protein